MTDPEQPSPYRLNHLTLHPHEPLRLERGFFFLLVRSGSLSCTGLYHHYLLRKGDLCILTPSMHLTATAIGPTCSLTTLSLMPAYFDSLSDSQPFYKRLTRFHSERRLPTLHLSADCARSLENTLDAFNDLTQFPLYRRGLTRHLAGYLLLQLTDILYRQPASTETPYVKRCDELFRNFKKLLNDNYREQHRIRFYADRLHISTTYLSRIVKSMTGRTVRFHLSELICADARKLLECSDMSIKGIADLLGFSNQSVFEKFFSTHTGTPPLKYRQRRNSISEDNISKKEKSYNE